MVACFDKLDRLYHFNRTRPVPEHEELHFSMYSSRPKKRSDEAIEEDYYYFSRVAAMTETIYSPADNSRSERVRGFIVGDSDGNALYVPIEANPRIELEPEKEAQR
ncbi:hypothetical protein DDE05_40600 [Streptomyces cavourensis]|nr:hypothetical protein DDE05_40600 [Streptomyces cavourensis]